MSQKLMFYQSKKQEKSEFRCTTYTSFTKRKRLKTCDKTLRTLQNTCTREMKKTHAARVFYVSLVFLNALRVLSLCNTRLRLLHLLNKKVYARGPIENRRLSTTHKQSSLKNSITNTHSVLRLPWNKWELVWFIWNRSPLFLGIMTQNEIYITVY